MDERLIARRITLYYTILAALFIGMSPQFMGFILPLIFLMPIFMGLSALKYRKKSGFLIALGIIPVALAVSTIWIKYSISTFNDMPTEVARMGVQYNMSSQSAQFLLSSCFLISIVMVVLCGVLLMQLIKHRKIFK